MTIIKTHTKLRRKIRRINKRIKLAKNEAKYYRDAAQYHQAVRDNIMERFNISESDLATSYETTAKFLEREV